MHREIAQAIAAHFHAEYLSTHDPGENSKDDAWTFVFRLFLSRVVPDSHRAGWSQNIYVDSRQRTYFIEVAIPASMLSVDWLNTICTQIEQPLTHVTFNEVNPTLKIRIAGVSSAAASA